MTTNALGPLNGYERFDGVPRDELERRILFLLGIVKETTANATDVQKRCTELLNQNRDLRLTGSEEALFCVDVLIEVRRARLKHPTKKRRLAALFEEAGEVAKAIHDDESDEATRDEAVQLAGQCLRLVTEGDVEHGRGPMLARRTLESGVPPAFLRTRTVVHEVSVPLPSLEPGPTGVPRSAAGKVRQRFDYDSETFGPMSCIQVLLATGGVLEVSRSKYSPEPTLAEQQHREMAAELRDLADRLEVRGDLRR